MCVFLVVVKGHYKEETYKFDIKYTSARVCMQVTIKSCTLRISFLDFYFYFFEYV